MQQLLVHLAVICAQPASPDGEGGSIFVSPLGSDANDGSETSPFLTLHRAQQAARTARQRLGRTPAVILEQGTHRVSSQPALIFTAADSGAAQSEALWLSTQPNASARVSGGVRLIDWEKAPGNDGVWRANASALADSAGWPFRTLRVGERLWSPTRWPLASAPHPWLFLSNWSCDPLFHPTWCASQRNHEESRLRTGRLEHTIPATLGIDPLDASTLRNFTSADITLFGGFERDTLSQILPLRQSPSPWNFSNPAQPTLAVDCYGYQPNQRYFFSNVKAS